MNIEELLNEKRKYQLPQTISTLEKKQLAANMPLQKIIGFIDFDNLKIKLNHKVLIPRYETEEVVHHAFQYIKKNMDVLDLCCGSGYIGLSIKQKTNANVTLSDFDQEAILQTRENAKLNNLNVTVIKSNLFKKIKQKFDVIVANPPYIPKQTKLDKSVLNYEPHHALYGGKDGNKFYRQIIKKVPKFLKKNGILIFEISPENRIFLEKKGFKIYLDINKKARIAIKKFN